MRNLIRITAAILYLMAIPAQAQTARPGEVAAPAAARQGAMPNNCTNYPETVMIPAGSFDMGSKPGHRVTIAKSFAMGKTEVTQSQWRTVMGNNPSYFKSCGDNCPVEQVSWDDVQLFIKKLSAKTGKLYRLPSEAEWEYACRAGGTQEYCGSDNVDSVAWYGAYTHPMGTSGKTTNAVATKQANAFGLYDMSGNVWEWVEDGNHYNDNGVPADGSAWQGNGTERVLRGGSWNFEAQFVSATFRIGGDPAYRSSSYGFRVARTLP